MIINDDQCFFTIGGRMVNSSNGYQQVANECPMVKKPVVNNGEVTLLVILIQNGQ